MVLIPNEVAWRLAESALAVAKYSRPESELEGVLLGALASELSDVLELKDEQAEQLAGALALEARHQYDAIIEG